MIVFDTETTGLVGSDALPIDKQPSIIEFSAVKLNDKTLKEEGFLDFLINPGFLITDEIVKITHITNEMLEGQPPFQARVKEISDFFLGQSSIVAHNCEFDCKMLEFSLRRIGRECKFPWPPNRLCTVELTNHVKGGRMKLSELYEWATKGGTFPNAHRAMPDVRALITSILELRKQKIL